MLHVSNMSQTPFSANHSHMSNFSFLEMADYEYPAPLSLRNHNYLPNPNPTLT